MKDGVIQWRDNEIYSRLGKVFIRKTTVRWVHSCSLFALTFVQVFKSKTQLFFRCSKSEKFPLNAAEILQSDRTYESEPILISFSVGPQVLLVLRG